MKRLLAFLICSVLALSCLSIAAGAVEMEGTDTAAPVDLTEEAADSEIADIGATADEVAATGWSLVSEAQFQSKLTELRSKYPNGSTWSGLYYESGTVKATTCWAYAAQMLKEVFGVNFYADHMLNYKYYDYSGITAGDWVRIDYDSHSIFIIKVTSSGVYYTDGNGTGVYNQIRWDGYYSWSEMANRFSYRLHLPGNNLTGQGIAHTVAYNANGGSGSMSSQSVEPGKSFKLKTNGFTRSGYSFAGYTVKRAYDNTWYTSDAGWQTQEEIYNNGYHYKIYPQGNSYTLGTPWLGSISTTTTFTFYAQWLPNQSTVEFMANYSNYNYMLGSDLGSDYADYLYSRNDSVYTVSVDSSAKLNNTSSLKIVGAKAGASGTDLAFVTSTNKGYGNGFSQAGQVGDDKTFVLHFYAKSSVDGAKMYFRWGYSTKFVSVTLSKSWAGYTVKLPKNRFYGYALHPYFDKAGTFYLNSLAMSDASSVSNIAPETGVTAASSISVTRGKSVGYLPTPKRDGYVFLGWYTAAEGGNRVTEESVINESTIRLYAHWRKDISYTPVKTVSYNGHYYELYDNALGWSDAVAFCNALGGHMVTIDDAKENTAVYDLIKGRLGYCWIGLQCVTPPKGWQWEDDTAFSYNNWLKSYYGTEDNGEYYALMYPIDYSAQTCASKWSKCRGVSSYSSYFGYYNSFFVCEYDDPVFLGDADGNGEVNVLDVTLIQRANAGMMINVSQQTMMRGDVDGNGEVDLIDAVYIRRYIASVATPYPVGDWIKGKG